VEKISPNNRFLVLKIPFCGQKELFKKILTREIRVKAYFGNFSIN
jgi:hypothetical protein